MRNDHLGITLCILDSNTITNNSLFILPVEDFIKIKTIIFETSKNPDKDILEKMSKKWYKVVF